MSQKKKDFNPNQARFIRKYKRNLGDQLEDFRDDLDDVYKKYNDQQGLENAEEDMKEKKIESQIQYFGTMMEPFNMRNERDQGVIVKKGFFVQDREQDKNINDAWLDSLDMEGAEGLLQKRKIRGVYSDGQDNSESEDDQKDDEENKNKNIKQIKKSQIQKPQKVEAPKSQSDLMFELLQLKTELCDLLLNQQNANQTMIELQKTIDPSEPQKMGSFQQNVRKQVKIDTNENQGSDKKQQPISDDALKAQNTQNFNRIVELCNEISVRAGIPDVFQKDQNSLEKQIERELKYLEQEKELESQDEELDQLFQQKQ